MALVAAPLEAQKSVKRPRDRILAEELAEFGEASLTEVIQRARPQFFRPEQKPSGARTPWRLLVYLGSQELGDLSVLQSYKASEVKEIRYYRPNEASTRLGSDNATVIQLTMKELKRP
jgi:hypothetical protein